MRQIIAIGKSTLDITFRDGNPIGATPGGVLLRMAAGIASALKDSDTRVSFVSETSLDRVGQLIVDYLDSHGVDTKSIDRYSDGVTPVSVNFDADAAHSQAETVEYAHNSPEDFDVVWPRINPGDIVVFGGTFAINEHSRKQISEILDYAHTRKALLVYVPLLDNRSVPRVTRIMPALLENLEMADMVIARQPELRLLFGDKDSAACFRDNISFYCPSLLEIGDSEIKHFGRGDVVEYKLDSPHNISGYEEILSAAVISLTESEISPANASLITPATRKALLASISGKIRSN